MRPKFRIGDIVTRKPLPKYKGNGQPIIIIEKITDKYYFGVTTVSDTKVMFDIEHQDDFMLYKPSFIRRIKCWFNNIKLIKSIRNYDTRRKTIIAPRPLCEVALWSKL